MDKRTKIIIALVILGLVVIGLVAYILYDKGVYDKIKKETFNLTSGSFGYYSDVKSFTISTDTPFLCITSIFAYDEQGNLINLTDSMNVGFPNMGAVYLNDNRWGPSNVLSWTQPNIRRKISDAINFDPNNGNNFSNNFGLVSPGNPSGSVYDPQQNNGNWGLFTFNSYQSASDYYNTFWTFNFNAPMKIACVELTGRQDCCYDRLNFTCTLFDSNGTQIAYQSSGNLAINDNNFNNNQIYNVFVADPSLANGAKSISSTNLYKPLKSFVANTGNNTYVSATVSGTISGITADATTATAGATTATAGATTATADATTATADATTATAGATTSNNSQTSLTITYPSMLPSNLQSFIADIGYPHRYQALANLQGNGLNDYIRYSGDDNGMFYTALYGDITEYSTNEKVIDANGNPYNNGSNMPPYSLYNPNNDRTISLNSNYAINLYNRLNGTNYTYNGSSISITPQATTTTAGATTTMAGATITTAGATTTTAGATTTMAGATTTTAGATTTMAGATTTMAGATIPATTSGMSMPSIPQIPVATPGMITNLLNNGVGIDYLTSQGIGMNSAYRGPSTNIVQTNFSGTSNVYSPYLYYNKGSTERFFDKTNYSYV
jgi:hypothetical protein